MKTYLKHTSLAIALLAGLASCEKDIDADIPAPDPFLSVACTFMPDSVWTAWVGKSADILDDAGPAAVTNAVVEIYEDGALLETLPYNSGSFIGEGQYVGTTKPQAGKQYSIKVVAPGFEPVTGSSLVPAAVPLSGVTYRDSVLTSGDGYYVDQVKIRFQDPPGQKNYYGLVFAYPDTFEIDMGDTVFYWATIYANAIDNGITESDFSGNVVFSDDLFDGKEQEFTFTLDNYFKAYGEKVYVLFATMTEEHYRYMVTFSAYQQVNGNPFAEPVQVHDNLEGGVGIFGGYNLIKEPLY